MTLLAPRRPLTAGASRLPLSLAARDSLIVMGALTVGALIQAPHPVLPDVGWLVLCAERVLGGEVLYRDIVEANPPMSVFLYLPVAVLRQVFGSPLLPAVLALIGAVALPSLMIAAGVLRRAGLIGDGWRWPAAAGAVLLILPLGVFGQREHLAALLILPLLAMAAARAVGARPDVATAVTAGLLGGLALCIKPHFVLAGALPLLFTAHRLRSWRALFTPEAWAAGVAVAVYAIGAAAMYPAFLTHWMPMFADTYRAVGEPWAHRFLHPAVLGVAAMIAALVLATRESRLAPWPTVLLLAASAFLAAALEQGKMWNNHLYPAVALTVLAGLSLRLPAATDAKLRRRRLMLALIGALGVAMTLPTLAARPPTTMALAPTIRALGLERPRLYALSGAISAGNPLASEVDAVWTGAAFGPWIDHFAAHVLETGSPDPATQRRLLRYRAAELDGARRAIVVGLPDAILVDRTEPDWLVWAQADPALRQALVGYAPVDEAAGVQLWVRRDLQPRVMRPAAQGGEARVGAD